MRSFLSEFIRRMGKGLTIITGLAVILLFITGQAVLIGALLIGYMAAAACIVTLVYRTWKSAQLSEAAPKKQMLWGLILRLAICFSVLLAAAQISVRVFAVTAAGFLLFYVTAMWTFIRYSRYSGKA